MKTLKIKLKNTKFYKRIAISFCSLLMVFASCFAPYSQVKAIAGVDDAFYAYAILTAFSVLGIGLVSTDASRDAIIELGNKAYDSFTTYVPMIGEAAVKNVTNFFQFCKDTGKMSLDKLNDIKDTIMNWFNFTASSSILSSQIMSNMDNLQVSISDYSNVPSFASRSYYYNLRYYRPQIYIASLSTAFLCTTTPSSGSYYPCIAIIDDHKTICYINSSTQVICPVLNTVDSSSNLVKLSSSYFIIDNISNLAINGTYYLYNTYTNFLARYKDKEYEILNKGTLELDPPRKPTDSFKLDDRVLGQDGTLDLTDTIVGATGALTLDKTKDVVTTLGTIDIPDTTLDYPYQGTWDDTLGGIGAIAWNPDIDVPIADTKIIAPTTTPDGESTSDKKVGDFEGEGGQLYFDWKNVFPFCIPFDLITFIKCLCADPEAPKMDIPFNVPIVNYKGSVSIDLSKYDSIAKLCRTLMDLLFILGLAYGTRELIKG